MTTLQTAVQQTARRGVSSCNPGGALRDNATNSCAAYSKERRVITNPGGALRDNSTNGCVADSKEKRSIEDTRETG